MTKLIIQIPCYNEEESLPQTLKDIPAHIEGVDIIETLVIDDGSSDSTLDVAQKSGVHHIVRLTKHQGLARVFMAGLDGCLKNKADIIINFDADNQYRGEDMSKLIAPIIKGEADMVIGQRNMDNIEDFSYLKKNLQRMGSWIVRHVSGTEVHDATSGFRAYSREAALHLNVTSDYTYTLETIIQAGKKNIALGLVPIGRNKDVRPSRLLSSIFSYIKHSIATLVRIYAMYEPLKTFVFIGIGVFSIGVLIGARFLYFYFSGNGSAGHIQSLMLAVVFLIVGFQIGIIGLVADLIAKNRLLNEETLYRIKKREIEKFKDNNEKKE